MEQDKKNWRRDDLATRIDLRMPNEIYDQVVEIATASGEKINPKSGQVRLTSTLNKLIEIGIRHLTDDNHVASVNNPVGNPIDIGLADRIQELEDKYRELSDSIKQDSNPAYIGLIENAIELALVTIREEVRLELEAVKKSLGIPQKSKDNPTPKPDRALTRSEIVEKLGKSRQSIEQRRDKGTLAEWGYKAEKIDDTWYYYPIQTLHQPK